MSYETTAERIYELICQSKRMENFFTLETRLPIEAMEDFPSKLFRPLHEAGFRKKQDSLHCLGKNLNEFAHRAQDGAPPVKVPQQH